MALSKLVTVRDEGTHMVFLITKFEPKDVELLTRTGWELSPNLVMITAVGPEVKSSIGTFKVPIYDVGDRSEKMTFNHTTGGLVNVVKDLPFDNIPDTIWLNELKLDNAGLLVG